MPERRILHVDMDAFFASVEQRDDPTLRGKPVLVGSDARRGVVAAASYEARAFGCHSAQPMSIALRRCPQAVVVRPRGGAYAEASDQVFAIFRDVTPLVEGLSIDEAFLDVTGTERLHGSAVDVAEGIRARIRGEVGLTASVGVAPNKFLAKLASDLDKPDGLTVIGAAEAEAVLGPLPIERMWGVGPATAARMHAIGIRTFEDLRSFPPASLEAHFGSAGPHYVRLARGEDSRLVTTGGEAKSISHEQTFEEDLEDPDEVRAFLLHQTEDVGRQLRAHGLHARTVTIKVRYGDFETITRSQTLSQATHLTDELWEAAAALFDRWTRTTWRPVRLIGMGASHFAPPAAQLDLFAEDDRDRRRRIDDAMDSIRDRYGKGAIRRRP